MPLASKLMLLSYGTLALSTLTSIIMGDGFGLPHFLMATVCGLSPIGFVFLDSKLSGVTEARADEMLSIETKLRTLEGDISKINLALKLRN